MDKITIIEKLIGICDSHRVLFDEESKYTYSKDLTQQYSPNPLAIVFPKNTQEVIDIVALANTTLTPLVPSGGRTGLSGGAVALNQEIVVSFEKMNRIIDFNAVDKNLHCEAGVTLKAIQDFALLNNLFYPINLASANTCQIGGNIATNAGGVKVIRYGMTRDWVSGLKVVTGKGDSHELNHGLIKNACGYDFRHLFIGSEGTLGFITEAIIKLATPPRLSKRIIFFTTSNKNHFIDIFNVFSEKIIVTAFEFFSDIALNYVLIQSKLAHPFSVASKYYCLLEYESNVENDYAVTELQRLLIDKKIIIDALISKNSQQAEYFWRFRKEISMSLHNYSPFKYDIAVLPSKISDFIKDADDVFKQFYPEFDIVWFGHIGDGNCHLNILKPSTFKKDKFLECCLATSDHIYSLVKKYHGSISAEHGVGLQKKNFLHYSKTDIEIETMRHVKKIFDPNNIMNPGKIF